MGAFGILQEGVKKLKTKNGWIVIPKDFASYGTDCETRAGIALIGLGGIRPGVDGAGYQHFVIRPGVWAASPLQWTKCRFDSPYGTIESNWRREGERMLYSLVVPPNTSATVFLRDEPHQNLTENGKPLSRVKGVRRVGQQGSRTVLELQAGQYLFEAQ